VSENEVVSFDRLVVAEAGFVQCLVARFSILKVTEPQPLSTSGSNQRAGLLENALLQRDDF
jgi:hypothetical protein